MRDPVTDFVYPDAWVAACSTPSLLPDVERGLAVLTSTGKVLRRGFSTGTTAAAACKAAVLSLKAPCLEVRITMPCGIAVDLPARAQGGVAGCFKDPGDYPDDATAGIEFRAEAAPAAEGIRLVPGEGIGRFARETPRYRKGSPAISAAPLACILRSIEEACRETGISGVSVRLSVPDGKTVALHTLNPKVGIEGGISVLGTTGLVEPWDDHLQESALERVAAGTIPVLTTGRIGLRYARLMFPDREVVLVGSRIAEAVGAVQGTGILIGLPGLILRFIRPDILGGTGYRTVEEYSTDPAFPSVMREALAGFRNRAPNIRVIIIDRTGIVLGETP
jgi:cobalt-precorrin-5B (C1)-methyltransferase